MIESRLVGKRVWIKSEQIGDQTFHSIFDMHTGKYIRSNVFRNGKDTGKDPLLSEYPELLDVGIMGHCIHGESGLCIKSGVQCYQDGLHSTAPNMTLDDFKSIVEQCEGKTFQIALGGCGDPDQYENFEEILKLCKEHRIVPNFTTSGLGLTSDKVELCKQYCGAVAVSWYRSSYTVEAIHRLIDAGVKTNIHYVLGNNSIDEAISRLENNDFPEGINAVVFLLHKPVGLGTSTNVLQYDDPKVKTFFKLVDKNDYPFKIGFDSCTIPGILNFTESIDRDSLDTCEGSRWSAYITSDMKMLPCSFDNQDQRWAVDLHTRSIAEAWASDQFNDFRKHFRTSCVRCKDRLSCMGGCPIRNEIVLCNRKERKPCQTQHMLKH